MKNLKKFFATLMMLALILSVFVPVAAYAEQGTLGTEEPFLYCSFYDEGGNAVDGNSLVSGNYQVDVMLSGMQSFSVLQFTADYNPDVVTSLSVDSTMADSNNGVELGGTKNENNENNGKTLVAVLASNEENGTDINDEGEVFATLQAAITCPANQETIDFQNYFLFNTDADLTFAEADYRDGIEDAYVLDTTQTTTYNTYQMFADESPAENELEPDITVSGTVVIAADVNGGASNYGARGVYFMVDGEYLTDENDARIITSDETGHFGEFTITLPAGTTEFQVVPGLSERMARTVTISGADSYEGAVIPVHYADYNNDGFCNGLDMALFKGYMKNYNYYGDYNNDGFCNGLDMALFKGYYNKTLSYQDSLALE